MAHTLFIDRSLTSINNVFTLQETTTDGTIEHFKRLPGRSGQRGYEATSWVNGKSPIPLGKWWLKTKPGVLHMEPKGTPFFYICSDQADPSVIKQPDGPGRRTLIGLHFENNKPGSIGCQVAIRNKQSHALFDYLEALNRVEPWIRVIVL